MYINDSTVEPMENICCISNVSMHPANNPTAFIQPSSNIIEEDIISSDDEERIVSVGNVGQYNETGCSQINGSDHVEPQPFEGVDLNEDPIVMLSNIRKKHLNRIIIGHININHLAGKFEALRSLIKDKLDVFVITETKIDASFPNTQFLIDGFSTPYRLDRNINGGGILIFVSDSIPCNEVEFISKPNDIEGIFLELNLRQKHWLVMGGYNPKKQTISYFLNHVGNNLDKHMEKYDNFLLIGDFNSTMQEEKMKDFCQLYDLSNLITQPTCYKNPSNPTSIDVILTNRVGSFQDSSTIETGLSDFHKLVVTVLKVYVKKKEPVIINYRSYKSFDLNTFSENLKENLKNFEHVMSCDDFKTIFMDTLDKHAPMKKKTVRGNQAPFMSQGLSKAIMHRSKLKNRYNKDPTEDNKILFHKQRNHCVKLLRKEKRRYYNNLDLNIIQDNKRFWQNIKPLFSDKHKESQRSIVIVENGVIISDNKEVAEKLNTFFIESVENLKVEAGLSCDDSNVNTCLDIDEIIKKYTSHPSILKIKEHVKLDGQFTFKNITEEKINKDIRELNPKKACIENDIPTKILVGSSDIVSEYLTNIYNDSKNESKFPSSLKSGTVVPINKKGTRTTVKKDYRPVNLLPVVSKLYERNMYEEIFTYIEKFLSPYLFGYRKNHSTEQCLTVMLEVWKKALDSKNSAGAVLTDLSKAFDCINHELLIAKLDAYGFSKEALIFIFDYLKNRKQRTKIGDAYSSWLNPKWGVPQGSTLGPPLFNIFINDLFFFIEKVKIANFADDNTPYSTEKTIDRLINVLQNETSIVLNWFTINEMKSNDDKCHLFVPKHDDVSINLGTQRIEGEKCVTLLGVMIDKDLNFSDHILNLLKKGNQKIHALARISKYVSQDKLKLIMRTFIESQFSYCPLTWMFHSRILNNKINNLHKRALRLVYKNDKLNFQELLDLDNSTTIHQKNLRRLAIEMYKVKNKLAPGPMQNLFDENTNSHNLRNETPWNTPKVRTVTYGTETVRYRGPKIWDSLPNSIKEAKSLNDFKEKIKLWKHIDCTCRLCKTYIANLGFLE